MSDKEAVHKVGPVRHVEWPEVAHEVAEYFSYEPRVAAVNTDGGVQSDPFGRVHSFAGGVSYYFMTTVFSRLKEADTIMRYICDGRVEQPSASMVLRAAYGATATKYDDSAPSGAKFLRLAQEAYATAAGRVGRTMRPNRIDQVVRRFDLLFSGAARSLPSDEDD